MDLAQQVLASSITLFLKAYLLFIITGRGGEFKL
jgi:hypothetical protein